MLLFLLLGAALFCAFAFRLTLNLALLFVNLLKHCPVFELAHHAVDLLVYILVLALQSALVALSLTLQLEHLDARDASNPIRLL